MGLKRDCEVARGVPLKSSSQGGWLNEVPYAPVKETENFYFSNTVPDKPRQIDHL